EGSPFHALVKSSGVSAKNDSGAGGSFGIGKNAAFAISALRTVFYSTCYETGDQKHFLAQGKSLLVSHGVDTEPKRKTGYWGKAGYMPLDSNEAVPVWLCRDQPGTTVASIGVEWEEREWHWYIVEALLRNFFAAINGGMVRFSVQSGDNSPVKIDGT